MDSKKREAAKESYGETLDSYLLRFKEALHSKTPEQVVEEFQKHKDNSGVYMPEEKTDD